jgi:hypothetical protein
MFGAIHHFDGQEWVVETEEKLDITPTTVVESPIAAFWGSAKDVWAVGAGGKILRRHQP